METFLFRLKSVDFSTQVAIALFTGLLLGVMTTVLPPTAVLFIILGIPAALIAVTNPVLAILAIITLLCTVIPDYSLPMIYIGPGQVYPTDLILAALLGMIVVRWLIDKNFRLVLSPLGLPVFAFIFWAYLSTLIPYLQGQLDIRYVIPEVRTVAYYAMFFIVSNLVINKRDLKWLVNGFFFLATIVAGMMVAQFILGTRVTIIPGRVETLVTEGKAYAEVTRIMDTVGEGLITVAFITKTTILFIRRIRVIRTPDLLQWGLLGTAVILTFSRTHWLVTGLAMIITFFMIREEDRLNIIKWGLVLFFIMPIFVVPMLIQPESLPAQLFIAAGERLSTLNPQNVISPDQYNTLRWRDFEYRYGLPQVASHPVTGLGLGAIYRPPVWTIEDPWNNMQHFTHNSHLWIAMKTGLVGYALYLITGFMFVWRGFRRWSRISDPQMGGVVLGFTLAFFGAFFAGIVHPIFVTLYWTPLLGLLFGTNEAIYQIYKPEETPPPPPPVISPTID